VISQWLSGKTCVVSDSVCWNFWSEFLLAGWTFAYERKLELAVRLQL